jgi:ABC-2 type transport system ATP-binding protein
MIEVRELSKYFGRVCAVDRVSFVVGRGEIVGLLGPNGSGKTTLMRVLTGFFPPTSGRATVDGRDVERQSLAVRRRLGYVPEQVVLYPELPVRRFLGFAATVKGLEPGGRRRAVEDVMTACGLADMATRPIGKLSRGYRQRVAIAQALLGDPEVLVLDEPTVGLDPRQTIEIRGLIRTLAGRHTVLLSTHILPEASALCSRVIIIDRGRVIAEDTAAGLARRVEGVARTLVRVAGPAEAVARMLTEVSGVTRLETETTTGPGACAFVVVSSEADPVRRAVAARVVGAGFGLLELRSLEPSLEEVFVRVVGSEGRSRGDA